MGLFCVRELPYALMMAASPPKLPVRPAPPVHRPTAPAAPVAPQRAVQPDPPLITAEELADLRARLGQAEARVKDLESSEARLKDDLESARAAKVAHAALPPPAAVDVPPLVSIAQITPAVQASPVVERPSKGPSGTASIVPSMFVKGAQKKRRAVIAVTGVILTVVLGVFAVMVISRTH